MPEAAQKESDRKVAIIDGSNVAHSTEANGPRLENIMLVWNELVAEEYDPVIVVDAALRHQIDDRSAYEAMVDDGRIKQAPAGTDADYFILSFAREFDARIVSNDRFRDRESSFPDLSDRLIRFMLVDDEVVLERRAHRRAG